MENTPGTSIELVSLQIEEQTFKINKDLLCEHSDYFRAMFSGSYVETEQKEIKIDVVDAASMNLIMRYMEIGLIDLTDLSLPSMNDLAVSVNFLQITELITQVEYTLEIRLSLSNWMEILTIAENALYSKLEQYSTAFGLFSFGHMKPKYIPSISRLFWYLSHPYLHTTSELDVFKFGIDWILNCETGADAIIICLGCLDVKKLTSIDLYKIKLLVKDFEISLAAKVVDCLFGILSACDELNVETVTEHRDSLCEMFTERVYKETLNVIRESKSRELTLTATVPVWAMKDGKQDYLPHDMYMFSEKTGLEKWIEVADRNLWGWSVVSWGLWRLVMVCGERGRGTGAFIRDVRVYDTMKKEWTQHGVELPPRRHGGVTIIGDSLYIIGGVGGFRVVLDTALIYNLKERSFRTIASLPDAIQCPATCAHEGQIYVSGHNNVYRYEDSGDSDRWVTVIGTDLRLSTMISFKGSIYCTQNYFSYLYIFKPGVDTRMTLIRTAFSNPPASVCDLGHTLLYFTRNMAGQSELLNTAEEYMGRGRDDSPRIVWAYSGSNIKVNDVAGACSLVLTPPPMCRGVSRYHKSYLDRYIDN